MTNLPQSRDPHLTALLASSALVDQLNAVVFEAVRTGHGSHLLSQWAESLANNRPSPALKELSGRCHAWLTAEGPYEIPRRTASLESAITSITQPGRTRCTKHHELWDNQIDAWKRSLCLGTGTPVTDKNRLSDLYVNLRTDHVDIDDSSNVLGPKDAWTSISYVLACSLEQAIRGVWHMDVAELALLTVLAQHPDAKVSVGKIQLSPAQRLDLLPSHPHVEAAQQTNVWPDVLPKPLSVTGMVHDISHSMATRRQTLGGKAVLPWLVDQINNLPGQRALVDKRRTLLIQQAKDWLGVDASAWDSAEQCRQTDHSWQNVRTQIIAAGKAQDAAVQDAFDAIQTAAATGPWADHLLAVASSRLALLNELQPPDDVIVTGGSDPAP